MTMRGIETAAFSFVETISQCDDADRVAQKFREIVGGLGYSYAVISEVRDPATSPHRMAIWPKGWGRHYIERGYFHTDPVTAEAVTNTRPFTFDDALAKRDTAEARLVMAESRDAGMAQGLVIPIHGTARYRGIVSVSGAQVASDSRSRAAIHLMALYCHERLTRLQARGSVVALDRRNALSPRERECLHWVAAGKTDDEIATILAIRATTAHWHVENAKRKLDVATRIQAVIAAYRAGDLAI